MITRLDTQSYFVFKGQTEIELNLIKTFCYHEHVELITECHVFAPDQSVQTIVDAARLRDEFGIWVESGMNTTTTLSVLAADDRLYGYQFEVSLKSTVKEEPSWFNTTNVKINFLKPPCEVTQQQIDQATGQ